MSIPWDTVNPALLSLVNALSGVQTVWIDKRRPFIDPVGQAVVLLRVRTEENIGIDDRQETDLGAAAPLPRFEEKMCGHRRVSLEIRVESFRHDDDRFAFNIASEIRTRLGFNSSLAALREVNVSLIRVGSTIDLPNVSQDDRITSVALFEVFLNAGITTSDNVVEGEASPGNRVFSIETVEAPEGTYSP